MHVGDITHRARMPHLTRLTVCCYNFSKTRRLQSSLPPLAFSPVLSPLSHSLPPLSFSLAPSSIHPSCPVSLVPFPRSDHRCGGLRAGVPSAALGWRVAFPLRHKRISSSMSVADMGCGAIRQQVRTYEQLVAWLQQQVCVRLCWRCCHLWCGQ